MMMMMMVITFWVVVNAYVYSQATAPVGYTFAIITTWTLNIGYRYPPSTHSSIELSQIIELHFTVERKTNYKEKGKLN